MNAHELILVSGLTAIGSGLPALVLGRRSNAGQRLCATILVVANLVGMFAVYRWWIDGPVAPLTFPSPLGSVEVGVALDGISAFFLLPVLLVTALGAIYGVQYWQQSEHPENGRRVSFFFGVMTGAMTLLVSAQDGLLFLAAWETMAIAAMFLVATEDHIEQTRKAAWLFIAASHVSTLCAFGVFAILFSINGSWEFATLKQTGTPLAMVLALLAFFGFGTKAGIMPMHVWLPSAHAQAPSHVSAVMSGVLIKMGIYGIVRVCTFFPEVPLSWGLFVLAMGTISAVLGVAFAVGQHDIKRLLAYHSIENIGIIVMGIGLALVGKSTHQPLWILLGISGALLHVWNHALFKSLLFLGAGSVIHSLGTREIDRMGGLSKRMPWTANCFLIGAVAICGLPPLNGFVSELFIYLGLFQIVQAPNESVAQWASLAAPALALVGALAVACFVKVYGIVFLGSARNPIAERAHEAGPIMIFPMLVLAGCCVVIGVLPASTAPILDRVAATWAGRDAAGRLSIADAAPLMSISIIAGVLILLLLAGTGWLLFRGIRRAPSTGTWDCGYAAPTARMQYTSSSFAETLVGLFAWALQPKIHGPSITGLFPPDAHFESHVDDTVLEKAVWPATRAVTWLFAKGRYFQNGSIQAYLMYILLVIVFLLIWK